MGRMHRLACLILSSLLIAHASSMAVAAPAPRDVLRQCQQNQEALLDDVVVQSRDAGKSQTGDAQPEFFYERAEVWRHAGRVHVKRESWGRELKVYDDPPRRTPDRSGMSLWPYNDRIATVNITHPLDREPVIIVAPRRDAAGHAMALATMDGGSSRLSGFLFGDAQPLPMTLAARRGLQVREDHIGAEKCWIIDAMGPAGKYTVWFDAEHGCVILRAQVEKYADSTFFNRTLGEPDTDLIPTGLDIHSPAVLMTHFSVALDHVELAQEAGAWYPKAGTITMTWTYADDHERTLV